MTGLPAPATQQVALIGRTALVNEILTGVDQGRRIFALEGISGVGKTAVLAAVVDELAPRDFCPVHLDALDLTSEDLAIAAIYAQLKGLPRDPEALIQALGKRLTANLPKAVRAVTAAVMVDVAKLATDKFGKTFDVVQKLIAGDLVTGPVGEALDQLEASNKRVFLTEFLQALAEAGTHIAISIDNVDQLAFPDFIRFLILAKPEPHVFLLAHDTERGDNPRWDSLTAVATARRGLVLTVPPLDPPEVAEWFHRDLGAWPEKAELESILKFSDGRPYQVELAIAAIKAGVDAAGGDYSGYYINRRRQITGDARTVAELLAILPYYASVGIGALATAAAHIGCIDVGPALDRLGQDRLLKRTASTIALAHALAQDTWRQDLSGQRWDQLVGGWYEAYTHFQGNQLTGADAAAIIPVVSSVVRALPPAEVAKIGTQLVKAGQLQVGLELVDSGWKFEPGGKKGGEEMLQQALLAAKTRLDLGRYREVDEPLIQAERSTNRETKIEALLLRMKLTLRRNAYGVLWPLAQTLDSLTDHPGHLASGQATLNVAYRDLLNFEGIERTTERLQQLRSNLSANQQMSIDRSIARALAKLKDLEGALAAAEQAVESAREIGTARDLGNAFLARAEVRRYRREYVEALDDYHAAEELGRAMGNRDSQLWSLLGAAAAQIEQGDTRAARLPLDHAAAMLSEPGYEHPIESAHAGLLRLLAGEEIDVDRLLQAYEGLGIGWPRERLAEFGTGLAGAGPTPL
jgi:tetratricopeptide (TPR) repeat protein